jgi:hypothetical protein
MRLSEQLLESHSATRKPEQTLRKELMEGFSKLDFTEASRNFIFAFSLLKQNKNCENQKVLF